MAKNLLAARMQLALVTWAAETSAPGTTAAAIGSWWQRQGSPDTSPTETYLKLAAVNSGWTKQNTVNLNIFNIQTFGAVGDGVTDDTAAIQAATDAAQAAGGGTVYIPPAPVKYRITRQAGPNGGFSILLNDYHNITFLGDGWQSWISMIGSASSTDWYGFYLVGGCSGIKFINFHYDGDGVTSPDPTEQDHGIEFGRVGATDPAAPNDIEVSGMYFGRFVGDALRTLGQNANGGNPVNIIENLRVFYNAFDLNDGVNGSRSAIEAQRLTRRIQFHFNWVTGSHDQEIDFEPTGGLGTGVDGPDRWSILGNHILHTNDADAITLSGIGSTDPSIRNKFGFNTLSAGAITGLNIQNLDINGNIIDTSNASASAPINFVRYIVGCVVDSNICSSLTSVGGRRAISIDQGNGFLPQLCTISNNVCSNVNTAGSVGIYMDGNQCQVEGNVIALNNTGAAGNGFCVDIQRATTSELDQLQVIGNLGIGTGASLQAGMDFHVNGEREGDCLGSYNFWDNCQSSILFSRSAAETYVNYHGAQGNNLVGAAATGNIGVPATNIGAQIEGQAGPSAQIDLVAVAAGPAGGVPAVVGSLCTNTSGGNGTTMFYKETGAGVTGGTSGWLGVGEQDLNFGAAALTTTLTNLFLAPGGMDLATEITTEIQINVPRRGTLRHLRGRFTAGTGTGTCGYRARKNGSDVNLVFNVANTAIQGSDLSGSVAFAPGDLLSFRTSKTGTITTPQTNVVLTVGYAGPGT